MLNYNLGLVSISFRDKSPMEIVRAVKDAQLACIEWGGDVHAPVDDLQRLQEIANLQSEYGVYCSSYGTYFRLGINDTAELEGYISAAKTLGTDVLRLWCGNKSPHEYTEDEKLKLFEECKKAAVIAERAGVKFCLECHNNTYTETKETALELMGYVSSPNFKMYWQPNQFKSFEENVEYIRLLKDYTEHIHVFNWKGNDKFPLADAKPVWQSYLAEFAQDKTLLLEFMPDNRIESLNTEAEALCEII